MVFASCFIHFSKALQCIEICEKLSRGLLLFQRYTDKFFDLLQIALQFKAFWQKKEISLCVVYDYVETTSENSFPCCMYSRTTYIVQGYNTQFYFYFRMTHVLTLIFKGKLWGFRCIRTLANESVIIIESLGNDITSL